jgi:hypothetical protein
VLVVYLRRLCSGCVIDDGDALAPEATSEVSFRFGRLQLAQMTIRAPAASDPSIDLVESRSKAPGYR